MYTVFTWTRDSALIKFFTPQVRRSFKGGTCLKIGRYVFHLCETIIVSNNRLFIVTIHLFRQLLEVSILNSDLTTTTSTFREIWKNIRFGENILRAKKEHLGMFVLTFNTIDNICCARDQAISHH